MPNFRNTKTGRTIEMTTEAAALFNDTLISLWGSVYWPSSAEYMHETVGVWETVERCGSQMTGFAGLREIPVTRLTDGEYGVPDELENGRASDGRFISPVGSYKNFRGDELMMTRGQLSNVNHNRFLRQDHGGVFVSAQ